MRLLISISAFALSLPAFSAPFLVTDPIDPRATECVLTMKGGQPQTFAPSLSGADKICRIDVGPIFAPGPNDLTLLVAYTDPLYGRLASTAVPFSAVRPGAIPAPSTLRLVP